MRPALSRLAAFLRTRRGATLAAAGAVFLAVLLRGPAQGFVYDAAGYWNGGHALLTGGDFYTVGRLDLRGTLTVGVYLPAIIVTQVLGHGVAGWAALMQNSLLIAILGAVIVPRIAGLIVPIRNVHIWMSAAVCGLLLSGFAPYPLMDLWALALVLLGILVVCTADRWWSLALGGLALGVALNLRPAYLAPVALGAVVWLAFRWRRVAWVGIGALVTIVPQMIVNLAHNGPRRPWPAMTAFLSAGQSESASYVVRYDTVAYVSGLDPRQAYCNPHYAALVSARPSPWSGKELASSYFHNLPSSLMFVGQKVSASLHWSWATPYADPAPARLSFMTPLVILVSVIGILGLIRHLVRRPTGTSRMMVFILVAVWVGSLATLAFAQPETRFALPLVLIGLVGCLVLIPSPSHRPRWSRANVAWSVAALALAAVLLGVGMSGLAHPAPPGNYSLAICEAS